MILLSLALVVATAATLAWGVFASSDPFIWVSLAAGIGALASVAGSVVRHRRRLAPEAVPDTGQPASGSAAVGAASAGVDPAPSPTPSRPAPSAPAPPTAGPVSPSGAWPGAKPGAQPDAQSWPWSTTRPPGAPETRSGWTGPVPVPPPPADEAPAAPAAEPEAPADEPPVIEPQAPADIPGEPGIEQVAVRDALRVAQLDDEVLVVDGHPRYHLAGCPTLGTDETIPLAVSAARRSGFTPCAVCTPDATLLARSRDRAWQKAQQRAGDRATERPTDEGQQL